MPDGNVVVEALFIAEFVPLPNKSKGKFAGVTGSWFMYAWTKPFVLGSSEPVKYVWASEGTLVYKK